MSDFESIFNKHDTKSIRTIDKDEFEKFMIEFCKVTKNKDISINEINDGWKIIIKNGDGQITKNDLKTYVEFLNKENNLIVTDISEIN